MLSLLFLRAYISTKATSLFPKCYHSLWRDEVSNDFEQTFFLFSFFLCGPINASQNKLCSIYAKLCKNFYKLCVPRARVIRNLIVEGGEGGGTRMCELPPLCLFWPDDGRNELCLSWNELCKNLHKLCVPPFSRYHPLGRCDPLRILTRKR